MKWREKKKEAKVEGEEEGERWRERKIRYTKNNYVKLPGEGEG